ncbi:D-alanyl-D-alanine carboxypeptidase [Nibricoccus aquaticus]|uniref:D-alanyl-D-alanine carboxypeptidase n=1 Tax=Nibricoccus aquaticus TaxID=2576891 RepID=A0A290Q811_9BACT|nr:M15 family metallopeptidase [Nibricoccus aquaticus]ATC64855.1 D-alanyl-D-alanine carboxypeptidase [Nibricoccus aquaticus]
MSAAVAYARRIAALHEALGIPHDYSLRRLLDVQPEADPAALVSIGQTDADRDCQLIESAAHAFRGMRARAREYDIELMPLSGFRSVERQVEIIRGKLALGEKIEVILNTMAAPGYSEHHTGRAIDIGTPGDLPLEESFSQTKAFSWLERHAGSFGFAMSFPKENPHGFIYEPWHWCWRAR